jgi:lipopolysaccharide export LptBFGC system permease protein LptF
MSLQENDVKIKCLTQYILILVLSIILSILVYISSSYIWPEARIEYIQGGFEVKSNISNDTEGEVVASKNGTKYYYSHCSGAGRIKEENIVIFDDFLAAEKAGYELAKNCK